MVLFPIRIFGGVVENGMGRQCDVSPDGRFLVNTVVDDDACPITVTQNWHFRPWKPLEK